MKITKDKKTGLFNLEGMTEGKLLCLQRLLHEPFVQQGEGLAADLYLCVERGVNANIAHGTQEKQ